MSNIPLNIDWQQIVLHLMNFVILAGGLYFLLYGPVKKFMAKRVEYYSTMDQETKDRLENARTKEVEYNKHLSELESELEERRVEAERKAQAVVAESVNEAKAQAEQIISEAKTAAMQERANILESTEKEVVQMAMEATEKILADDAYEQFLSAAERSA